MIAPHPAPRPVLIVEGDDRTAELERRVLMRIGRSAVVERRASEAIARLGQQSFCAVVVDSRLAGGGGWRVLDAARRSDPLLPVIVVAPFEDEIAATEAVHRGAADFVIRTGEFWEWLPSAVDRVSRLAEAEMEVRRAERIRGAILDALPANVALVDKQGVIVAVNRSWARFATENGFGGSDFGVGTSYLEVCDRATGDSATEASELAQGIRAVLGGKLTRYTIEYPCHAPGERRWFQATVAPLRGDTVDGAVIMHVNITQRRLAEEAVRVRKERYRSLVTAIGHLVWSSGAGSHGADEPAHLLSFSGRALDDLMGSAWETKVHPDEIDSVRDRWREAEAARDVFAVEYRALVPGGGYRLFQLRAVPVSESDGSIREWVGARADVTERRHLEEQSRQAAKMEVVGQLAGGIAHDFNNLLTVIGGYVGMLLHRAYEAGQVPAALEEIQAATDRGATLTRQLLAFSRRQAPTAKVVDLNVIAADMDKMLRRLIGETIELRTLPAPAPAWVKADRGQLEQLILNLAINARDAMPNGGALEIRVGYTEDSPDGVNSDDATRHAAWVVLTVTDTGTGMSEEVRSRIFEPFFTTKEPGRGTGLGLATAYGIVRQSSGEIRVESTPGRGSVFRVYFPLIEKPPEEPERAARRAAVPTGSETVLLVEDEGIVRRLTRSILEGLGYAVLEARNGEEALELCNRHEGAIPLLITDIVMPRMSGPLLAHHVVERRPGIRVLFLSGYAEAWPWGTGTGSPPAAFLAKPFTPSQLAERVREMLDR